MSLFAPVMKFLMWLMFSLLKCFIKCCSMIFWISCGCDTHRSWSSCTNWIFWCFMCRAFTALNIRVSSLALSTSPTRFSAFFFSGISNFLIHLSEYLFARFSQLFVLLWVFVIFNLESYVLLFFRNPFKVWIWYLVVIFFLLVSNMSFCSHWIMSLSFSHLYSCCAVTYSLLNFLSISFLVLFILCKLSCVEPLLIYVGHPLMINSCPCHFYSGNDKSLVWRCLCPSVWTCIGQSLLVLLVQDNVINLILYRDSLLCYWISSSLRPGCDVLYRVLILPFFSPSWYHSGFFCLLTNAQYSFQAQFFFLLCCWNPLPA